MSELLASWNDAATRAAIARLVDPAARDAPQAEWVSVIDNDRTL